MKWTTMKVSANLTYYYCPSDKVWIMVQRNASGTVVGWYEEVATGGLIKAGWQGVHHFRDDLQMAIHYDLDTGWSAWHPYPCPGTARVVTADKEDYMKNPAKQVVVRNGSEDKCIMLDLEPICT